MNFNCLPKVQTNHSETQNWAKEKRQLMATIAKFQHENLIKDKKIQVLESEICKILNENHELVTSIEHQTNQKLLLLQKGQEMENLKNFENASTHKFQNQNKILIEQNERIRAELECVKMEKVSLLKERQNASNKLLIAQSKLEALQMQEQFFSATLNQKIAQIERMKEDNQTLSKRMKENGGGAYVKTILKDNNHTKEQLLNEFQEKINSKQRANSENAQKYENKISCLNLKIAQLQAQIASK